VTPPFPEYLSGHSTFSAAAAALLKAAIGSDTFGMSVTIPAGSSKIEPGAVPAAPVTLSWKSFYEAADQAGISREYGGIHFNDGDFEARQAGEDVGLLVWSKAKTYFNGKAIPRRSRSRARTVAHANAGGRREYRARPKRLKRVRWALRLAEPGGGLRGGVVRPGRPARPAKEVFGLFLALDENAPKVDPSAGSVNHQPESHMAGPAEL
jgi:hypothetical protein